MLKLFATGCGSAIFFALLLFGDDFARQHWIRSDRNVTALPVSLDDEVADIRRCLQTFQPAIHSLRSELSRLDIELDQLAGDVASAEIAVEQTHPSVTEKRDRYRMMQTDLDSILTAQQLLLAELNYLEAVPESVEAMTNEVAVYATENTQHSNSAVSTRLTRSRRLIRSIEDQIRKPERKPI